MNVVKNAIPLSPPDESGKKKAYPYDSGFVIPTPVQTIDLNHGPEGYPAYPGPPSVKPSPIRRSSYVSFSKNRSDRGKQALASSSALSRDVEQYENRFAEYQRQLNKILAKHNDDWDSLVKTPKDKEKYEAILKRWSEDESRLESLLAPKLSELPAPSRSGKSLPKSAPPAKAPKAASADDGEELNPVDIDR